VSEEKETERKTLSLEEFKNIYVENATVGWMKANGLDPSDPGTRDVELDLDNEDSQMYAWHETAKEAFDFMIATLEQITERGYDLSFDEGSSDLEEDDQDYSDFDEEAEYNEWVSRDYDDETKEQIRAWLDEQLGNGGKERTAERKSAVTKGSALFIFLETSPGTPKYVGDVREWLAEIDRLNIPDDTEVDGQLYLDYDINVVRGERAECLECEDRGDVLLTTHHCKTSPTQPTLF
jgi:hypothetical protein